MLGFAVCIIVIILLIWICIEIVKNCSAKKASIKPTLYERLGGVFGIAAVIDKFSDRIVENPILGKNSPNPALRQWHREKLHRLPGLKFQRTLWICAESGGGHKFISGSSGNGCPFKNSENKNLTSAHKQFNISRDEFNEASRLLGQVLDEAGAGPNEKREMQQLFAKHSGFVIHV